MTDTSAAGAINLVSPSDRARAIFAAFDAKDASALAAHMTDDVRLRLGNAETVEGKTAFVKAVNAFLASDAENPLSPTCVKRVPAPFCRPTSSRSSRR